MKIGFWSPDIGSNAAPQRCLRWTVDALERRSDVDVVVGTRESVDFDPTVVVSSPEELAEREEVDLVHWVKMMDTTIPLKLDIPTVLTYHGDIQWCHPRLNYGNHPILSTVKECLVDIAKIWQYDAVCFVSNDLHSRMQNRLSPLLPKTYTTPNAAGPHISYEEGIEEEYVFHLSVHGPRKNPKNLLRGFAQADIPHSLVLGGSGWESERNLINELGIDVNVLGYIPDGDLSRWYSGASAFLFPSLHECFGLPAVEAIECHTTPVVSDRYSLPEVAGEDGVYCDPTNPDSIATALERAVESPNPDGSNFSWEETADKLVGIYNELCH